MDGTYTTLLSSSGSEGSLGKEDLGVLASDGMSPISLLHRSTMKYVVGSPGSGAVQYEVG
jgi:hypothetical protein